MFCAAKYKRLSKGRFPWWPQDGSQATCTLQAHQLAVLLSAGDPTAAKGAAINYMRNHWNELTLFLREPGAPLDNNVCERALKQAILHRKNAYFYKTDHGARMGDLFMSLIHTCELNGVNALDDLTQLHQHAEALATAPADWMPWNYHQTLKRSAASGATDSPAPIR